MSNQTDNTIILGSTEWKGFHQIASLMKNAVVVCDKHGFIVWVNPAFERMTGYSKEEVVQKKPKDFLQGSESDDEALQTLSTALHQKQNVEVSLVNYKKSGEKFYVELQIVPLFNEAGDHIGFISIQRDLTVLMSGEEELTYNLRQQELLAEIALDLNNYSEFETSINKILEALLHHTGVSRIYIFENVDEGKACSNTFEVCNEGVEPQIENLAYLPYEIVPYWEKTLQETGYIFSENIKELPEEVREILEPQEIKSILVLPLIVYGKFFGFIGFDECVIHKKWKRTDLELLRAISGIIGNAYEREIARKNLVNKNEELNKINAELDNFVYSVSHDLRSPLLSVKGILDLVFQTTTLDEKTQTLLRSAESSVNRLDNTIQEILDYSRNSRLGLTYEWIDLVKMIEEIYADLKYAAYKNLDFRIKVADEVKMFYSDSSRLNTILKNVIGNSIKYHRKDTDSQWVEISAANEDGKLIIKVADNGEGISEEHLPRIFEMFYRASKSSSGSGLGLYICKEIAQKINSTIQVTSEVQVGTMVTIIIPMVNP
jgi:PAS domain S-box-containing protein